MEHKYTSGLKNMSSYIKLASVIVICLSGQGKMVVLKYYNGV